MSFVVEYIDGRVPVVCGAGSNNTEEALGLVQYAKKIKADGVLVVTPYYNRPTQEGLYRHYSFLARKADIPMILYNVPGRTGVSLAPETVARLAKIANFVGIKEASSNLDAISRKSRRKSGSPPDSNTCLTFRSAMPSAIASMPAVSMSSGSVSGP
jgi:4-hydroxy-tetrahydrodipicolinate synthase